MKKIIYKVFIILLIVILAISSYFIYKKLKQNKEQEETFEELADIVEDSKEDNDNEDISLKDLYELNNDLIGWIKIDNTSINYPVMQSAINNYYLRRDFYKKYSSYGTPFIAEGCNVNTSDNIIIYGHHINGNKMFGELEKYKNNEFYENHKIIKFYTLNEDITYKSEYEIFAVFKTTAYNANSFKYYNYINFENENEFNSFMDKVKNISMYETDIVTNYEDKFITLSTCEYSTKNGRLVIMARKTD